MSSVQQEDHDPDRADEVYLAATRMLTNRTRDTRRFRLLYRENVFYGFCRNLWGLKAPALLIAGVACAVCGALVFNSLRLTNSVPLRPAMVGIALLAWGLVWCFWFTPSWVKIAADAYAERLLEASDDLTKR